MGCVISKRKRNRVAPLEEDVVSSEGEVTVVETIYLPLALQPALEEPRKRESEQEVLKKLKEDGVLRSETLREKDNGSVAFFVSLDGNPYPSGKPRLLEPIELKYERDKIKADLDKRMSNACRLRKDTLRRVKRKARIASARQRQAVAKREKTEEEQRRIYKERLEIKMERAARKRQQSRQGHRKTDGGNDREKGD